MTAETSKVISFRLNSTIEDEQKAMAILDRWEAQGWPARQTIVRALLGLEDVSPATGPAELVAELRRTILDSQRLAEQLQRSGANPINPGVFANQVEQAELRPELKAAMLKASRQGFKLKE